jgi:hypothetical protein
MARTDESALLNGTSVTKKRGASPPPGTPATPAAPKPKNEQEWLDGAEADVAALVGSLTEG